MRSGLGWRALTGALLSVLVLGGCGETSPDETDGSSSVTPDAPAEGETGTPSPSPEEPTVPLASGAVLENDLVRLRAPRGWELDDGLPSLQIADERDSGASLSLSVHEDVYAEQFGASPLEKRAKIARGNFPGSERMRILDPVELDGVEFFHLSGPDRYYWNEVFGTSHEGMRVEVTIDFPLGYPKKKRERIVASVLPTLEWL